MKKITAIMILSLSIAFNGCGGGGGGSDTININGKTVNVLSSKPDIHEPANIDIYNNMPDVGIGPLYTDAYEKGYKVYVVNSKVNCTDYSFSESDLEADNRSEVAEQKYYQKYESGAIHCSQTDFLEAKGKYTLVVVSEIK